MMSSMVMTPRICPFSSTTGMTLRSYFAILRATSSWSSSGFTLMTFWRRISGERHVRLREEQIAERRDPLQLVAGLDGVDVVDVLVVVLGVRAHRLDGGRDGDAGIDVHVRGGHEVTRAGGRPLLDLADVLGALGVDLLEVIEDGVAHRLGQDAEEIGAIVGRHLAGDLSHALGRHQLGDLFLLVLLEALEDRRGVRRGHAREELGGLVGIELADEIGEVLGVDLLEELAHLIGILLEDLLQVRSEQ